jgi:hypothetical protein
LSILRHAARAGYRTLGLNHGWLGPRSAGDLLQALSCAARYFTSGWWPSSKGRHAGSGRPGSSECPCVAIHSDWTPHGHCPLVWAHCYDKRRVRTHVPVEEFLPTFRRKRGPPSPQGRLQEVGGIATNPPCEFPALKSHPGSALARAARSGVSPQAAKASLAQWAEAFCLIRHFSLPRGCK